MIQRLACEMFRREAIGRSVATVITQVLVESAAIPDFAHPSKPIGEFIRAVKLPDAQRAAALAHARNRARPLAPRGSSPAPDRASWNRKPSPRWPMPEWS